LLTKRESEVIVSLRKVRIGTNRLFELILGSGVIPGAHESNALIVNFESLSPDLLTQCVASNRGTS
jgi:hypothetical protein